MPIEQLDSFFEVLKGGVEVAAENVVKFPVDAAGVAAETALAGEGIATTVTAGNGAAAAVSQLTNVTSEAAIQATTGLGLTAVDVGVAGAAIAPALGLAAGAWLYHIAPDFWTNVSNKLMEAGQTIGGKVRGYLNGVSREWGLSEPTIEIFKQAFIEAGLFNTSSGSKKPENTRPMYNPNLYFYPVEYASSIRLAFASGYTYTLYPSSYTSPVYYAMIYNVGTSNPQISLPVNANDVYYIGCSLAPFTSTLLRDNDVYGNYHSNSWGSSTIYYVQGDVSGLVGGTLISSSITRWMGAWSGGVSKYNVGWDLMYIIQNGRGISDETPIQPDATLPSENPFSSTYPSWQPWSPPEGVTWPTELPSIYPIQIPDVNPTPTQQEAQNPDPNPDPSPVLQFILNTVTNPDPITDPDPKPEPEPDPDPQPDPDPIPEEGTGTEETDPVDPNPPPIPGPVPPVIITPDTALSNKLFTVYAPTDSQLNALGGYLWSSDIITQLLKMWQNPLDGIISLQKVYAIPTTGASHNIILGYLDSGVSSAVVTSQFVQINCGSLTISEKKYNATDYTPYVDLHLYLPFIGFVELDPDEFMNGTITVSYKVDMYTGTCLADVRCTRSADMPSATSLYQFSGNASQQIPLTAGTANGLMSSLVSVVGAGLAVASGGALGSAGAALSLGHSLTHEMLHVGHSGSLSANAGIMGSRTPAVIIGRRHGYDANNYAEMYGYPANKTIYLGNTEGFTRVKACRLRTKATQNEKDEIMQLLKRGVIM